MAWNPPTHRAMQRHSQIKLKSQLLMDKGTEMMWDWFRPVQCAQEGVRRATKSGSCPMAALGFPPVLQCQSTTHLAALAASIGSNRQHCCDGAAAAAWGWQQVPEWTVAAPHRCGGQCFY